MLWQQQNSTSVVMIGFFEAPTHVERISLFIVRTESHSGPNMLADGHKKPLLSGLSFANFENDLVC